MAGVDDLDLLLRAAVASGLMTEAQARDVDAFADGLARRILDGELTEAEAHALAAAQAITDAKAQKRGRS